MYLLPNNYSESQRWHRPAAVTNGKYRDIEAMSKASMRYNFDGDTLLIGKTDRDEYFAAMMKVYSDRLDSLAAGNYEPNVAANIRSSLDRALMYQMVNPPMYYSEDFLERNDPDRAQADSVSRFTPEQVAAIRSRIDFSNPLLELKTMGNPGYRSLFTKAQEFLK